MRLTWYEALRVMVGRCARCSSPRPGTTWWMRQRQPLCRDCVEEDHLRQKWHEMLARLNVRYVWALSQGMSQDEAAAFAEDNVRRGWDKAEKEARRG